MHCSGFSKKREKKGRERKKLRMQCYSAWLQISEVKKKFQPTVLIQVARITVIDQYKLFSITTTLTQN